MDVSMPDMNGPDAHQRIRELRSERQDSILTMHEEEDRRAMPRIRCAGYIIKDAPAATSLPIEVLLKGEKYLSPVVLQKVVAGYVKIPSGAKTSYDRLTPANARF